MEQSAELELQDSPLDEVPEAIERGDAGGIAGESEVCAGVPVETDEIVVTTTVLIATQKIMIFEECQLQFQASRKVRKF